ncbi:MAG: NAD(P)-dependent alcohol dehydrogenase [Phycisphaeraceae bacterium]|nr:MAG: NAD(P)-dependent alcohol dehydrogenase [Phycisphaeraceae bacterium]
MLAATYRCYGPPSVLSISEVPTPSPGRGEVLIRVRASTVSSGDVRVRSLDLPSPVFMPIVRLVFGVRGPRNPIPGAELSGVIEAVGDGVDEWNVGDLVIASTSAKGRANAQFVAFPADGVIVRKPDNLGFEEAACLPFGGLAANYFLQRGGLRAGQRVLINGASGSLGTHAVQLAHHAGAHVTAVCTPKNHALMRELGADEAIDYQATPLESLHVERKYDILFETVGKVAFAQTRHLLAEDGRFLAAVMTLTEMRQTITTRLGRQRVIGGVTAEQRADLQHLADLSAAGHLTPPIDRVYPLEEIAAAHAHAQTGHKVGHIVLVMPA